MSSLSCGRGTRTSDLQVMSLASYQLLHPAIFVCGCKGSAKRAKYKINPSFFFVKIRKIHTFAKATLK